MSYLLYKITSFTNDSKLASLKNKHPLKKQQQNPEKSNNNKDPQTSKQTFYQRQNITDSSYP